MTDDLRTRADARLETALQSAGVRDPRPYLRRVLKHLKERDAGAFERAVEHFEATLIPAVAGEADPLSAWLEYGRLLARLVGEGRLVAIDGTGRAHSADRANHAPHDDAPDDALLLFLPDAPETPALVLRCPRDATPAQDASIELLVQGRVTASERLSAITDQ